jgi:hypothetical protein
MKTHLILTVGTGTAGAHSFLPQGLVATVRQTAPHRYWLVPSAAPASIEVADYVRGEAPEGFTPWADDTPYRLIERPDDLVACRAAVLEVILRAQSAAETGSRVLVNPTSGTKQMSAGATLAAIEAEAGDLMFTVGERADGVVITGTERLVDFSTETFFLTRDRRTARALYDAGGFAPAAKLLERYGDRARPLRDVAMCRHAWHRFDYAGAASKAATVDCAVADAMHARGRLAQAGMPDVAILADILSGADSLMAWNEPEEALTRYVKALEYAARMDLARIVGENPPFKLERLREMGVPERCLAGISPSRDGTCALGLKRLFDIVDAMGSDLRREFYQDRGLSDLVRRRNESMHETEPVRREEIHSMRDRTERLLCGRVEDLRGKMTEIGAMQARLDAVWAS